MVKTRRSSVTKAGVANWKVEPVRTERNAKGKLVVSGRRPGTRLECDDRRVQKIMKDLLDGPDALCMAGRIARQFPRAKETDLARVGKLLSNWYSTCRGYSVLEIAEKLESLL